MPKINILDKSTAELIAAGEVVERPASVIKELLENSVDAGATNITAEIRNGGITYIRVTDNGCGIAREDVPTAFISHATSKLKCAEDLDSIFTLGFRGEALPSIASVARVELLTRHTDEQTGTRYVIDADGEKSIDDAGCPLGTTVVVRDLFYNTPARMKFLKKDVSEANAVAAVIDRIALSHPEISFRFIRDGKQAIITSGNGDIFSCAYTVLGRDVSQTFIPVDYSLDGVKVSGLVSKPAGSRATRSMQFFYLNSRYIKSKTIMAALEEAYKGSVMVGRFPAAVMNVAVDVHTVDVNVHPTKTEVRFSDEKRIFSAVYYAVKSAVTNFDTRVQADMNKISRPAPVMRQPESEQMKFVTMKSDEFLKKYASSGSESLGDLKVSSSHTDGFSDVSRVKKDTIQQENRCAAPLRITPVSIDILVDDEPEEKAAVQTENNLPDDMVTAIIDRSADEKPIKYIGEAFKTYIIVEQGEKLLFIDKHAAHERMIYEKIKNQTDASTQVLITPVNVALSKSEYTAVVQNTELLRKAGYEVDDFGTGSVRVRECPMYIDFDEIPQMIQEIAGYIESSKASLNTEKLDWILHNTACRAAVKAGDKTDAYELEKFAKKIINDNNIRYCPHGRPVILEMSRSEIEKMFGRIQ